MAAQVDIPYYFENELASEIDLIKFVKSGELSINQALFLKQYRKTPTNVSTITKKIGISRSNYYKVFLKNDKFVELMSLARSDLISEVEGILIDEIRKKRDPKLIMFFLERMDRQNYGSVLPKKIEEKTEIEGIVTIDTNEKKGTLDDSDLMKHFEKIEGKS